MNRALDALRSLAATLVDLVLPRFCLGCGASLGDTRAPMLLCPLCRGRLARCRPSRVCSLCARPLPAGRARLPVCLGCLDRPPPFDRLIAAWWYRPPLDRVLWALKFDRLEFLAEELIAEASANQALAGLRDAAALTPVPLAPLRRLTRGFNQSELLAAEIGDRLGIPCCHLLSRCGLSSLPQRRRRARDRRRNPDLRFANRRRRPATGSSAPIVLVDDIVTTGSTLRAAAATLLRAGRGPVWSWVVAATPPFEPQAGPTRPVRAADRARWTGGRSALTHLATDPRLGI